MKGQTTLFMLLGVFLLIVIALVSIFSNTDFYRLNDDYSPVENFINLCVTQFAKQAIIENGKIGGSSKKITYWGNIPLAVHRGESSSPPNQLEVEKGLSIALENEVLNCVPRLKEFLGMGYSFIVLNPKVNTKIRSEDILFQIDFPITIFKDSREHKIEKIDVKHPYRLTPLIDISQNLELTENVCLPCLIDFAINNDMFVSAVNIGDKRILYTFEKDDFQYRFVHSFR